MRGQLLQQYLNSQADRIEAVLRENDLLARVDGGLVGPRLVVFRLRVAGHAANLLDRLRKLEETLALRLDQSQVQIRRDGGRLLLLVPLPGRPRPVWLESFRHFLRPNTMLLGVRADAPDHPLLICPAHPDVAHILVTGSTGSGKTVLLKTMILSLAAATPPERARLILIDPKGGQFAGLERLPQLAEMVRGRSQAVVSILAELVEEMERRGQSDQREPRIYVFIDELADALAQAEVAAPLTRLAQRGRGSGLHLVAGTAQLIDGLDATARSRIVVYQNDDSHWTEKTMADQWGLPVAGSIPHDPLVEQSQARGQTAAEFVAAQSGLLNRARRLVNLNSGQAYLHRLDQLADWIIAHDLEVQ